MTMHTIPLSRPCPFCGQKMTLEIDARRSYPAIVKHPDTKYRNEFCYTISTFFASRTDAEELARQWIDGARKWEEGTR